MMLQKKSLINILIKSGYLSGAALLGSMVSATTLTISDTPLFLESSVQSNIYFVIDDSGSMTAETIYTDGAVDNFGISATSKTNSIGMIDFSDELTVMEACSGFNSLYYDPDKTYSPWVGEDSSGNDFADQKITAANNANPYNTSSTTNLTSESTITTTTNSGWGKDKNSSSTSTTIGYGYMRFNDLDGDGYLDEYTDLDGDDELDVFIDLNGNDTFDGYVSADADTRFGNGGVESELECPNLDLIGDTVTVGSDSLTANEFLATWFTYANDMDDDEQTNFANWYSYYRKRKWVVKVALSDIITDSTQRMGITTIWDKYTTEIKDVDDISLSADDDAADNKDALLANMFQIGSSGTTPLRSALVNAGNYFAGTSDSSSPILSEDEGGSCQQNFTIMMTDGFWNGSDPSVGNEDSNNDSDWDGGYYADEYSGVSNTLADVAMYYYETDLDSTLDDSVPTNSYDENTAQHMVTYMVAFGVSGSLNYDDWESYIGLTNNEDVTIDSVNDYIESDYFPGWPTPSSSSATTIDDVWHAAYNGRGLFLNAQDPDELIESLESAIDDIDGRNSAASAVSVTTGSITSTTMLYTTSFNSSDWIGRIYGYAIDSDGSLAEDPVVASYIPEDYERTIISWNTETLDGVPFVWEDSSGDDAISSDQQTEIGSEDLLEYIRGEDSLEGTSFRERGSWESDDTDNYLGDIINSAPAYLANPIFLYDDDLEDDAYSDYRTDPDGDDSNDFEYGGITYYRTPMLYVGANDGMLHAFQVNPDTDDADFGQELFAYVPSMLYDRFEYLADEDTYNHAYYADGSPYIGDAYFDNEWHSVLVAGLNAGGQGVYALDVTDPDSFDGTETAAARNVLWEFNDDSSSIDDDGNQLGDDDLGYTFSRPTIAKSYDNGNWVAIFGNGYNNNEEDGHPGTGTAVLYVVNLETGALIKKIDTGVNELATPNGLSSPVTLDTDGDAQADYVYAGDFEGNLWKFDISSDNTDDWDVALKDSGDNMPLFTACNEDECDTTNRQSITVKPIIGFNSSSTGYLLYFGTGSYFLDDDNSNKGIQTFYAIWDKDDGTSEEFDRTHLLKQEIVEELSPENEDDLNNNDDLVDKQRITTNYSISWHEDSGVPNDDEDGDGNYDTHLGWYLDLYNTEDGNTEGEGERVVADALLRDDSVIFVTVIPSDDPCSYGGNSWYMELIASSGSRHSTPVLDVDGDGDVDEDDYILSDTYGTVPSSGRSDVDDFIISMPVCVSLGDGSETCYSNTSDASVSTTYRDSGELYGRWEWREL
ncbi:pilus assembly protein [Reinekea marinisedimentorum]|uniref:Type IV pilus assembly protein PilY1 n=1 Tax=Reinekea marinisedimentorum TaxID=230495 RepID=A0A4R3IEQ0_9GAMM|nr:PilC/PilY family type IV pilus protein [Reinekea marinisedimentorum]TCS43271.1 type IV pilus assembly protein PilY1 [Reinekea marinisedimentorum]